ncbi:hypothetical protein MAH4_09740 [Sessilibacter sp. MAH4]
MNKKVILNSKLASELESAKKKLENVDLEKIRQNNKRASAARNSSTKPNNKSIY